MSEYGIDPTGGWSRFSFSNADLRVKDVITGWISDLGMTMRTDPAGNYIARLEGNVPGLPAIALGSHIDTVKNGGMFDGTCGVAASIEVIETIVENNVPHNNPIELLIFAEVDGAGFGASLFGSKAMSGNADPTLLNLKNEVGLSLGEAIKRTGCDPMLYRNAERSREDIKCFLELHIEQGDNLYREGIPIGVVTGIVGFEWVKIALEGKSDHAGTVPMYRRKDAMLASAEITIEVEKLAKKFDDSMVATVGKSIVSPNSINIVPKNVEIYLDVRDISIERRNKYMKELTSSIEKICNVRGVKYEIEKLAEANPAILSPRLIDMIAESAEDCGYPYKKMYSRAGHDAQLISTITESAMIFVPSKDGISHSPDEWTSQQDIEKGANVLLQTTLRLMAE